MSDKFEKAIVSIKQNCDIIEATDQFGQLQVSVAPGNLVNLIDFVKNDESCQFRQLTDIAGVDYPERENRFDVIYHFLSFKWNARLRIKTEINENGSLPSICSIFPAANWFEREAFDMYGIQFTDHPDLRRILTD